MPHGKMVLISYSDVDSAHPVFSTLLALGRDDRDRPLSMRQR